ncbi:MAG: hypothetical protein IJ498_05580 [Akkermansia sp.]|nr:hypothetical protein [Akkermansia sp.]
MDNFARAAGENFTAPQVQFHVQALPAPLPPLSIIPQPTGLPFFLHYRRPDGNFTIHTCG